MNILILGSKEYPMGTNNEDDIPSGGMETYLNDIAKPLSTRCKLYIITRRFEGIKKYEEGNNIRIYRVKWIKGFYFRNLSFNISSFMHSLHIIPKEKIDIIYCNGVISIFFGLLLSKLFRKKLISRPAGIGFVQYKNPLKFILYNLERFVYKKSDFIILHSSGERYNLEKKLGVILDKTKIIPTGFPIEKFQINTKKILEEFNLDTKTYIITSIGRYHKVKGYEYLIKAISFIKNKNIILFLVGDGPERKYYEKLINELNLSKRVILTGFRYDIPDFLAVANIFVISSLSEGLPTSLLEALASGTPSIVTDIGLPIENMKTGLIVESKNSKQISNAISFLLNNKKIAKKIGDAGKRYIQDNYSMEKTINSHVEIFNKMISD